MNVQTLRQFGSALGPFTPKNIPLNTTGFRPVLSDKTNVQPQDASVPSEGKKKSLRGRASRVQSSENVDPSQDQKKPRRRKTAKKAQPVPFIASKEAKAASIAFFGYSQGTIPSLVSVVPPKNFAAALELMVNDPYTPSNRSFKAPNNIPPADLDAEDISSSAPIEPKVELPAPQEPVVAPIKLASEEPTTPKASLLAGLVLRVTSIAKAIFCLPLNTLVWAKTSIIQTSTKTIELCQSIFKFRRDVKIDN